MAEYILAIDQGTTGTTALIVDGEGKVVSCASQDVRRFFPQPGWVEQDANELYLSCLNAAGEAVENAGISFRNVSGIGITNQRETTVVWERKTGTPVGNVIVWQCRRTANLCEQLKQQRFENVVREKTGLIIDAYFSATKLRWILDNIPNGQKRAECGELRFGTVDSWLLWKLTGGRVHSTDCSNASRTMLFNIHTLKWDDELLRMLDIPKVILPEVKPNGRIFGETAINDFEAAAIPIGALMGDQQSALFGQACYASGTAKNTYGTGSFILFNTGNKPTASKNGLLTTVAWNIKDQICYALEGSIFVTGAAVQWLRDGLKIIGEAAESEILANSVPDNGGVYFVPAFVGLGAPYWDMYARGAITGLTQGSGRGHIVRAALESIAYQTRDVIDTMSKEANTRISILRVDGGGTANDFLMQFQSDILGIPIQVAAVRETTALGAAYMAGLSIGTWKDTAQIEKQWRPGRVFEPKMSADKRESLYNGWKQAVERARR